MISTSFRAVLAMIGFFFVASACRAGIMAGSDVYANLGDPLNYGTYSVTMNYGDGAAPTMTYGFSGAIPWTQSNPINPRLGSSFDTFCIEITQDVYIGSTNNHYTLANLASAPNPGPVPNTPTGSHSGMGPGAADAIARMWNGFYGTSPTALTGTSLRALFYGAAFQLDVWKIEYDWNSSAHHVSNSFTTGNFRASSSANYLGENLITAAQDLLNEVNNPTGNYTEAALQSSGLQLVALTSPTLQDQVALDPIPSAPEPSSFCLAFISGLVITAFSYHRRRATAAVS